MRSLLVLHVLIISLLASAAAQKFGKLMPICGPKATQPCANPPRGTKTPDPDYSEEARSARLEGQVVLWLVVTSDGTPEGVKVVKGLGMGLDEQAVKAIKQWKFQPAMYDGKPVPVQINVEVNFRLPK